MSGELRWERLIGETSSHAGEKRRKIMKFLLLSRYAEGAHLLWLIKQEGNEVALWVEDKLFSHAWEGILPRITNWKSYIDNETIVLFDTTGLGHIADSLRKKGHYTFGASNFADDLEKDRVRGIEVMQESGIKIPGYHPFTSISTAKSFLSGNKDRWVLKPIGETSCKLTFPSEDNKELIGYLDWIESRHIDIGSFILQKFVEGIAVSSEGWSNGKEFIYPFNHTIEDKKFLNDGLGPATGCSGNVVWAEFDSCRIINEGIAKLNPEGHVGPIDLNAVVNEEGIWGLEWTPRFGYDSLAAFVQLYRGEWGKLISDFARGQGKDIELESQISGGIRISIPPYPLEPQEGEQVEDTLGMPIQNIDEEDVPNFFFYEVMQNKDGNFVHSDGIGLIAAISALGDSPDSALDLPYKLADKVKIPDIQYRTDLQQVLSDQYLEVGDLDSVQIS